MLFFKGAVSAKAFIADLQTTQSHGDVETLLLVCFAVPGEGGMVVLFLVKEDWYCPYF